MTSKPLQTLQRSNLNNYLVGPGTQPRSDIQARRHVQTEAKAKKEAMAMMLCQDLTV